MNKTQNHFSMFCDSSLAISDQATFESEQYQGSFNYLATLYSPRIWTAIDSFHTQNQIAWKPLPTTSPRLNERYQIFAKIIERKHIEL